MPSLPEMPKLEMPKIDLPEMPKIDLPEMPDIGFTFQDFSAIVVDKLSPIEQLAPFKLGQVAGQLAKRERERRESVCLCVPVRERERAREKEGGREGERE